MRNKVSIIIPVYNTEKYLHRTLKSVLAQTYNDWECILIDDGSKDSSGVICDEYASVDSRIVVIHQDNSGVSQARNKGIEHSTGDWICFVDSDDILLVDAIDTMVERAKEYDSDVCICKLSSTPDTNKVTILSSQEKTRLIWSSLAYRTKVYDEEGYNIDGPYAKLFRSSIIRDNQLSFVSGLSRSEDAIFDAYVYHYSDRIILCDHSVYCYQYYPNSLSHSLNTSLPTTLFRVLSEEEKFSKMICNGFYNEAVYVRSFVGMYQIVSEFWKKEISICQHTKLLRQYLNSEIVHKCLNNLSSDQVRINFEGRSQVVKLYLARMKMAFLILIWIKLRTR